MKNKRLERIIPFQAPPDFQNYLFSRKFLPEKLSSPCASLSPEILYFLLRNIDEFLLLILATKSCAQGYRNKAAVA